MTCATFCRHLLAETRREAPQVPKVTHVDASPCLGRSGHIWAWVHFQGVAEPLEVSACCRYAARAKAIDQMEAQLNELRHSTK